MIDAAFQLTPTQTQPMKLSMFNTKATVYIVLYRYIDTSSVPIHLQSFTYNILSYIYMYIYIYTHSSAKIWGASTSHEHSRATLFILVLFIYSFQSLAPPTPLRPSDRWIRPSIPHGSWGTSFALWPVRFDWLFYNSYDGIIATLVPYHICKYIYIYRYRYRYR